MKTITRFRKEIAGNLTIPFPRFSEAVAYTIRHFAGEDECAVIMREKGDAIEAIREEDGGDPACAGEKLADWLPVIADCAFKFSDRNDGKIVPKKYRSWMLMPVPMKKEPFLAILIARRQGRFSNEEKMAARDLGEFFTQELKDVRSRNRKAAAIADETRHRILLRTQTSLDRKMAESAEIARAVDYSACAGSDMGQSYRTVDGTTIACVCDVTADDIDRQMALVYLDTWFSILSQTSLDAKSMLQRLNADMIRRTAECYASVALARYCKRDSLVEIAGTGSATAFFFSHDTMDIRAFTFGAAAGIKKDVETEPAALAVRPGDIVCLCTDGLTETKKANGDLFGADAIGDIVRRNYYLSAKELASKILRSVEETAEQGINTDDRTVQVLKIE